MASVLVQILPGELPEGFCFRTWQATLAAFANNMQAMLPGSTYYNLGDTKPAPELQAYPWLYTVDSRWYTFQGVWVSHANLDTNERRLYVGTLVALQTYDGGDTNAPSDRSGPMWEEDTAFKDRIPIGPSTIVANPLAVAGAASVSLTPAQMAHYHGVGTDGGIDDPPTMISRAWSGVTNFLRRINDLNTSGSTGWMDNATPMTGGTMSTTNPLSDGSTPTPTPVSIVPPVIGAYVIKPTGRLYYAVP